MFVNTLQYEKINTPVFLVIFHKVLRMSHYCTLYCTAPVCRWPSRRCKSARAGGFTQRRARAELHHYEILDCHGPSIAGTGPWHQGPATHTSNLNNHFDPSHLPLRSSCGHAAVSARQAPAGYSQATSGPGLRLRLPPPPARGCRRRHGHSRRGPGPTGTITLLSHQYYYYSDGKVPRAYSSLHIFAMVT